MAADTADLTVEILRRIQAEQTEQRRETRAVQQSFIDLARLVQRLDGRISDLKSDLETIFKMEIIGQIAHLETRLEKTFADSFDAVRAGLDASLAENSAHLNGLMDERIATVLEKLDRIDTKPDAR